MNRILSITFVFLSFLAYGQIGSCNNGMNSVTLSPVANTTDLVLTINSSCCEVHGLDSHTYSNNAPNHTLSLCYQDTGLLLQTTINATITLPNANNTGIQTFMINPYFYFGLAGGNCDGSMPFGSPAMLTFSGPLTQPRSFTLANNEFDTTKFTLSPNPNQGGFSISLPQGIETIQLTVFDLSGKQIFTQPDYHSGMINLNLSPGIYFAKVISGKLTETVKFVVL